MTVLGAALAVPVVTWSMRGENGAPDIRALTAVPSDDPRLGLVYQGLAPAALGTPCVGGYDVVAPNLCSHGPDEPPAGLDVHRDVAPVAASAPTPTLPQRNIAAVPADSAVWPDDGAVAGETAGAPLDADAPALVPDAAAGAVGPNGITCDGDGESGKRVQLLYVYQTGTASRFSQYLASLRTWAGDVDAGYDASAAETGGSRHIRYVTTPDCQVAVTEVEVPTGALDSFTATVTVLRTLGYDRTDRKYLIFADAGVYCGIGTSTEDDRHGSVNRNNGGPGYGRVDAGCWTAGVAGHELAHTLGAVNNSAPHSAHDGHCTDGYDVMCAELNAKVRAVCPDRAHDQRLDCNHDDYYSTNPRPGSYLATHWNVADSEFLIPGDVAGDAAPTAASPLRVAVTASTSVRIEWDSAGSGIRYGVLVNGRIAGWTTATAARVIGLRPDTPYQLQIAVRDSDTVTRPYTGLVPIRTARTQPPAASTWFTLSNALTGDAADLYAARAGGGAPVVLQPRTGGANQAWRLAPAGDGTFLLQSRATGKCVLPRGGTAVPGAPLVQQACPSIPAGGQLWRVTSTRYGFSLTAVDAPAGPLVIGAGQARFGGHRLLVLQSPTQARHQSWTALAG